MKQNDKKMSNESIENSESIDSLHKKKSTEIANQYDVVCRRLRYESYWK